MEITKNVCQEDAELILTSINYEIIHGIEIYEEWPKITIQKSGYDEYIKYKETDITVEFCFEDRTNKITLRITGFVLTQFGVQISFKDFDPDAFNCDHQASVLKSVLFPLANRAVTKKKGELLAEAENLRKIEKLLKL